MLGQGTPGILTTAEISFQEEKYEDAVISFRKLVEKYPRNEYYKFMLGNSYFKQGTNYASAIFYLRKYLKGSDTEHILETQFLLGNSLLRSNQVDESIDAFKEISDQSSIDPESGLSAKRLLEMANNAKKAMNDPTQLGVMNLTGSFNSEENDINPVVNANNSTVYLSSTRVDKDIQVVGKKDLDIFSVTLNQKNEKWGAAKNVGFPFNSDVDDIIAGMSLAEDEIYFFRKGKLYLTKLLAGYWAEPQVLNEYINNKIVVSNVSLSYDNQTLYFSSNRPGGLGGADIYKSPRMEDGTWGKPLNLGPVVNSQYDEISPFILSDNLTLYFCSKGHTSIGGFDVFRVILRGENARIPNNMGFPINSTSDDYNISSTSDGKIGYFTSNRVGGNGGHDIYKMQLPLENIPLTLVKGSIKTKDGGELMKVRIKIIDKDTKDDVKYVYNPNVTSGRYLMIFPPGKNYKMLVEAENYQPYEFNLMIPDQTYFYQLSQTITLEPKKIAKNKAKGITVKNNFYDPLTGGNVIMATRDSILLSLIERIIQKTDSIALAGLKDMTYDGQDVNEDKIRYEPLLDLIEEIINHEDVTTLNNLDLITARSDVEEKDFKIYFTSGNTELDAEAVKQLNKVCDLLNSGAYTKLYIFGHSDNQGSIESKMQISKDRAYAVSDFLTPCRGSKIQVTISKHGSHIPIASNDDEKGRRLNRRVEIKLGR